VRIPSFCSPSPAWRRLVLLLLLCIILLTGCRVEVYRELSEEQANAMLVVLLKREIQATKVAKGKNGFTLTVDEKQLVQALEILKENNLPRSEYANLGKVFSGQGMIPSPSEEQARLAYAISQELADTFSRIDGVLTARVHVVPAGMEQSEHPTPPSAAVFLRHLPDSPVVNLAGRVRELTAKAVPNLSPERVSVMLVPVREYVSVPMTRQEYFLGIPYMPPDDPPYATALAMLVTTAVLAGAVLLAGYEAYRRKIRDKTAGAEPADDKV
jgi:type III secretion protein J